MAKLHVRAADKGRKQGGDSRQKYEVQKSDLKFAANRQNFAKLCVCTNNCHAHTHAKREGESEEERAGLRPTVAG